jgi:uncharacterized membrane protein
LFRGLIFITATCGMNKVISLFRLFNMLSLDVAAGAVVSSLFFAHIVQASVTVYVTSELFLVVWIIYTADHLLDVINLKHTASTARHRFHQRNRKELQIALLLAISVGILLVFFLPLSIIKSGLVLFAFVLVYVILMKRLHAYKELIVAIVYVAGVALPALSVANANLDMHLSMVIYFLLAWINLIVFSWYDKDTDKKDGHVSIATLLDDAKLRNLLLILFAGVLSISSIPIFYGSDFRIAILFVTMALPLFVLFLFKKFFSVNENFRLIGDTVFLFPLFYLLL